VTTDTNASVSAAQPNIDQQLEQPNIDQTQLEQPNIDQTQLEHLRQQQPFGRLLIRAQRALHAGTAAKLSRLGYSEPGSAQGTLLAQLDPNGTRLTVLAERLGITKQSVGQLVGDLERHGYVTRLPDPHDRRATKVCFTARGWQFCQDINQARLELEAEYQALLGGEAMDTLRRLLGQLLEQAGK
jgi:DNA-binding MarR family transcriptional regulator